MATLNLCGIIKVKIILTLNLILFSNAAKVQFFSEPDFKGLIYETNSSCINLGKLMNEGQQVNISGSLKSSGCITISDADDCRHEEDTLSYVVQTEERNTSFVINSFRDCTELESRTEHDLDLYKKGNLNGRKIEYRDVCSCTNTPFRTNQYLAQTFGNCFKFYEGSHCTGELVETTNNRLRSWKVNAGSFKPCQVPEHCIRFKASIFSMEPLTNISKGSIKEVEMRGEHSFINSASFPLQFDYNSTKEIKETAYFEFPEALNQMSVTFEKDNNNIEQDFWTAFPIVGNLSSKLKNKMKDGFQKKPTSSSSSEPEHDQYGVESQKKFQIYKTIVVPPCTVYQVNSFAQLVENVGIFFRVKFKLTGMIGYDDHDDNEMKPEEIRQRLEKYNLKYLKSDHDDDVFDYRIIAETTVKLVINYADRFVVSGKIVPEIDCVRKNNKGCSCE